MGKILKIREVGDPCLYSKSEEVKKIDDSILEIIEDMKETLNFTDGFGIAAPQIGINKRIVIIQVDSTKCTYDGAEDVPTTVMINPALRPISNETDVQYEGCLSVPSIRGKVERYKDIEVTYLDENGNKIQKTLHGFTARDVQHECDHLDGVLFVDKVPEKGFATIDTIKRFDLKNKEEN